MDLKGTQLKQTFGNLVTIGTSAGTPTTGGLENGNGDNITQVGIGIDSPDYKLHLFDDTVTSSKKTLLQFDSNSVADGGGYNIDFRTSSNDTADRFVARIQGAREGSGATSQLSFFTDDGSSLNQRMLITANGSVGIGTTSNTTFALEVVANSSDGVLAVKNGTNDANTFRSSNASGTRTLDIGNNSSGHGILNIRNSSGSVKTQLLGSGTSYFDAGDVLIGKTSSGIAVDGVEFNTSSHFTNFTRERNATTGTIIQINRTGSGDGSVISFMRSGTEKGSISVDGTSTAFNTSSDYRLKENITSLSSCLDTVSKIKPSTFNFIDTPNKTVDGFIAHELAEVVPQAVIGEKDGIDENGEPIYQGVDHSKLVPLLVGAIQELKTEIEELKNK